MSLVKTKGDRPILEMVASRLQVYPAIGQRVMLITGEDGGVTQHLMAVVDSVSPDGRIRLMLLANPESDLIHPGRPMVVEYTQGALAFRMISSIANMTSHPSQEGPKHFFLIELEPPHDLKKIQRRRYFRIYVSLAVRFNIVSFPAGFEENALLRRQTLAAWAESLDELKYIGRTENLGAGGLYMVTDIPLGEWTELFLEVQIPKMPIRVPGRVIRSEWTYFGGAAIQRVGVEFVALEREVREQIVHFIVSEGEWRRRKLHST